MTTAREIDESMEGSIVGLREIRGSRFFHVTLDARGDDPTAVAELPDQGSAHPKPNFGSLIAVSYSPYRYLGPKDWIVEVVYESPAVAESESWTTEVRFSAGTKSLKSDIFTNELIGSTVYLPHTSEGVTGPPTHVTEDARKRTIALVSTKANRREGIEVLSAAISIIKHRRMTTFNDRMLAELSTMYLHCNGDPTSPVDRDRSTFMGFAAHTVLFAGLEVTENAGGIVSGQPITGFVQDVSLEFLVSPDGWTPQQRLDTYIDDEGWESLVYQIGEPTATPVAKRFNTYPIADLNQIFSVLGFGQRPPRRLGAGGIRSPLP